MEDKNISINEENNEVLLTAETDETVENTVSNEEAAVENETAISEVPLDRNVKLMSPMQMVIRRFFRSKLSIVGLVMIVSLFLFSFLGPVIYTRWGEIELDESGTVSYTTQEIEVVNPDGTITIIKQTVERQEKDNYLAPPSTDRNTGQTHQNVAYSHDEVVDDATEVACDTAENNTEHGNYEYCDKAY